MTTMLCQKILSNLSIAKRKSYLILPSIASLFIFPAYCVDISIPIGSTGYLGEIAPPVSFSSANYVREEVNLSERAMVRLIQSMYMDSDPVYDPAFEVSGFQMINPADPKGTYIILAPTGTVTYNYIRKDGQTINTSAQFVHGRTIATNGMVETHTVDSSITNRLSWALLPYKSIKNYFLPNSVTSTSVTLSSYGLFAIGPIKPGRYSQATTTNSDGTFYQRAYARLVESGAGTSGAVVLKPLLLDASTKIQINALKSCDVVPQSMTTINYATQFAKNYTSPTKLAENIASINVNCPYAGNVHLTLKPFNNLVAGSHTGMELAGTKKQESDKSLPYVVTSLKSQPQNSICESNAGEALSYIGSTKLGAQEKTFNQTLYYNLCANGNIASDRYSGSIDATFLIE